MTKPRSQIPGRSFRVLSNRKNMRLRGLNLDLVFQGSFLYPSILKERTGWFRGLNLDPKYQGVFQGFFFISFHIQGQNRSFQEAKPRSKIPGGGQVFQGSFLFPFIFKDRIGFFWELNLDPRYQGGFPGFFSISFYIQGYNRVIQRAKPKSQIPGFCPISFYIQGQNRCFQED